MKGVSAKKVARRRYETEEIEISPYFSTSCSVEDEANSAYAEEDRLAEFNPARGFYSGAIEQYINKM